MIFIAVGTQKFQLNRLLKQIDRLIGTKKISEKVFAQIGNSDYKPVNYEYTDFLNKEEFDKYIGECDVLITHSGVGTIISGLNQKKPVIVYPRLAKYNEHVDDHQLQIAESFSMQNLVLLCGEKDDLNKLIQKARSHKFSVYRSQRENVIKTVRSFINSI